jgi:hypothetical protein
MEKLFAIGKEWKKEDKHRIYFDTNELCKLHGLHTTSYKTGSILSAVMDGEKISNSKAYKIQSQISDLKLYFDINSGKFEYASTSHEEIAKNLVKKLHEIYVSDLV